MKSKNQISSLKRKIIPILKKNGVVKAGIFGSYATGKAKKNSDIDILIQIRKRKKFSLFDLTELEMKLKNKLKKDVDLLTYNGINPLLKERILSEEIRII